MIKFEKPPIFLKCEYKIFSITLGIKEQLRGLKGLDSVTTKHITILRLYDRDSIGNIVSFCMKHASRKSTARTSVEELEDFWAIKHVEECLLLV